VSSAKPAVDPKAELRIHRRPGQADWHEYPPRGVEDKDAGGHDGRGQDSDHERAAGGFGELIDQVHTMMIRATIEIGGSNPPCSAICAFVPSLC
jgi:hypothetical protein